MANSIASDTSDSAIQPESRSGTVRHLTEADLTEDERARLFSCLDQRKRWFDAPRYPRVRQNPKRS